MKKMKSEQRPSPSPLLSGLTSNLSFYDFVILTVFLIKRQKLLFLYSSVYWQVKKYVYLPPKMSFSHSFFCKGVKTVSFH